MLLAIGEIERTGFLDVVDGSIELWWPGNGDGVGGVEIMVKESVRVMTVVLVCKEDVLGLICRYALQNGKYLEEKLSQFDELKNELDMYSVGDIIM